MGSDFQRTILWVVLAAAVFMLWDNWQVYNGKPSFLGTPSVAEQQARQTAAAKPDVSVPEVGAGSEAVAKGMIQTQSPVNVQNDLLKLTIDEQGAVVTRAELLQEYQQADWTEVGLAGMILGKTAPETKNIELFNVSSKHVYVAQSGLIGGDFPNHKSQYKFLGTKTSTEFDEELKRDVKVTTATFEAEQGSVKVQKQFILPDGHYGLTVRDVITNNVFGLSLGLKVQLL